MPPKGSKLNTPVKQESTIEHTPEYDAFMAKLAEYHEKRGTSLEAEPKVGTRHLDLRKLYERVVAEGGYDLCSDTKAKPLMWRKVAEEFLGKSPHLAAQAFMVKSAYYKNLVAYEITNHWQKEPPPKEILEEVTAKGGNVMARTLENYQKAGSRDDDNGNGNGNGNNASGGANGNSSDAEPDEKTPKQERIDGDDPGSATGRSSRGLRHAPPQRLLFNPDTTSTRQPRNPSNHQPSPSPAAAAAAAALTNGLHTPASHLSNGTSMTLANYEPRQQYPLSLKPVTTPANNPDYLKLKRKQQPDAATTSLAKKYKGLMLPGTGFIGPNIYVRAQLALQSGIPDEEHYALHHLVKISHERGDKYRFDQFSGLAEALVAKLLQITNLFYDVDWSVVYDDDDDASVDRNTCLDGIHGTPNVLDKLRTRIPLDNDDDMQTHAFIQDLGRITEAGLVVRNMVILEENAHYISKLPLLRDYFTIVLNLPPHPAVTELQFYALETVEQLTKYYHLDSQDMLYQSLLAQLESNDRGRIVTSLRAISRIGMYLPANKRLEEVPVTTVAQVCEWIMLEDEELRSACLDFLFQYTSIADNVETLVLDTDVQALVRQLSSLLLFQAKEDAPRSKPLPSKEQDEQPTQVPRLASELIVQLNRYDEPVRSSHWLRMCFQDDPNSEMTQIHLWQSYQGTFLSQPGAHPHLIAGDFIKNVSNTFTGASAQVAGSNKYVIRGIKPRRIPVDYKGRELVRCQWRVQNPDIVREYGSIFAHSDGKECGEWFGNNATLVTHVLTTHLHVPPKREPSAPMDPSDPSASRPSSAAATAQTLDFAAAASNPAARCTCEWNICTYSRPSISAAEIALLARHVETHLPDTASTAGWKKRHNHSQEDMAAKPKPSVTHTWHRTIIDERNDAAGIPLGCALVLRNIARGIPQLAPAGAVAVSTNGHLHESEEGVNGHGHHHHHNHDNPDAAITDTAAAEEQAEAENGTRALLKKIFDPAKDKIFYAMAHNLVLRDYLGVVLKFLAQGGA